MEIDIVVTELNNEIEDKILELFDKGLNIKNINSELGLSDGVATKCLNKHGITDTGWNNPSKRYYSKLTDEQKREIEDMYRDGRLKEILNIHPTLEKSFLYNLMSRNKIENGKYFWTEEDTNYLRDNIGLGYDKLFKYFSGRHTKKAIETKAKKMGLAKPQYWTDDELEIMKKYYSVLPQEDLQKLLPNRTWNAIILKGNNLKIKSYYYLNEKYSEEENNFIKENFGKMTDTEIAKALGKTVHGICDKRRALGLYYLDKNYSKYNNISKFFRAHIYDWKENSMKQCNYQCIFTGSKDYAIHHIISFNTILSEFFSYIKSKKLLKSNDLIDYSKEELDNLIKIFNTIHDKYPLGVCVRKDIHNLFHNIYGSGGNTKEQWDIFSEKFLNHEYDDLIA